MSLMKTNPLMVRYEIVTLYDQKKHIHHNVSKIQTFSFAAGGTYVYHRNIRS